MFAKVKTVSVTQRTLKFFYFFETANFESLILIDPDYIFKFDDFKPNPQK